MGVYRSIATEVVVVDGEEVETHRIVTVDDGSPPDLSFAEDGNWERIGDSVPFVEAGSAPVDEEPDDDASEVLEPDEEDELMEEDAAVLAAPTPEELDALTALAADDEEPEK